MDFTVSKYKQLIEALQSREYQFVPFQKFIMGSSSDKLVILRHDVDKLPLNSLHFAEIQAAYGIKGSYYFRVVPESWDEMIIKKIVGMGHEIGYHYEDLTTSDGDIGKAYDSFCFNLERLRKLYPVKTICMHGSPRSPFDSRDIWNQYDYRKLGIVGEPYFDIDFSSMFYLTDTGRRWDGWKVSVRDKVEQQEKWNSEGLIFHSTEDIISAANTETMPGKIMFTFHPQRWTDNSFQWLKELMVQSTKNLIKRSMFVK